MVKKYTNSLKAGNKIHLVEWSRYVEPQDDSKFLNNMKHSNNHNNMKHNTNEILKYCTLFIKQIINYHLHAVCHKP